MYVNDSGTDAGTNNTANGNTSDNENINMLIKKRDLD